MSLPNSGMDAVPLTTLPAEFLDDIVENIEALAAGTGLNTNAIGASKLATSAITLGYAQITTNATNGSATPSSVTSLNPTVTIPAGSRKIEIIVFVSNLTNSTSGQQAAITLWDGAVNSGTQISAANTYASVANVGGPVTMMAVVSPSAGTKTYSVGLSSPFGGGTATINASTTAPAFILVKAI